MKVKIYKDRVCKDGTIRSGKRPIEYFEVDLIDEVKTELESRFGGNWNACSDGSDGMYENSDGKFGYCLVSNVEE